MSNYFHLKINTPFKVCFDDDILQVEICTDKGYIGILPNHIPIIGNLTLGNITIHLKNNTIKKGFNGSGLFCFQNNCLTIITHNFSFNINTCQQDYEKILHSLKKIKLDDKTEENFEIYLKKSFASLQKKVN